MKKIRSFLFKHILRWYVFDVTTGAFTLFAYVVGLRPLIHTDSNMDTLGYSAVALCVACAISMFHARAIQIKVSYFVGGYRRPAYIEQVVAQYTLWATFGLCVCFGVAVTLTEMFSFSGVFWFIAVYTLTRSFHLFNQHAGCRMYLYFFVRPVYKEILDDDIEWQEVSG